MPLYSRKDMEYDLELLDTMDQSLSRMVADGQITGFQALLVQPDIEKERRRCRMGLLNSAALIHDLRAAEGVLNARPSQTNRDIYEENLRRVFRAAGANNQRRKTTGVLGQPDTQAGDSGVVNELGPLERAYYQDRAAHRWPIQTHNGLWLCGYREWLHYRLEDGTLPLEAVQAEKERLSCY